MNEILKKYNFNKDNDISYRDYQLLLIFHRSSIELHLLNYINFYTRLSEDDLIIKDLHYIGVFEKEHYKNENDYINAVDKMILFLIKKYMKNYLRKIKYIKING